MFSVAAANERNNIRKIHTKIVQIITRPNRMNANEERMDGRSTRELSFTVRVHQSGNVHIRCGIKLDAYIVYIKLSSLMERAKSGASNKSVWASKRHRCYSMLSAFIFHSFFLSLSFTLRFFISVFTSFLVARIFHSFWCSYSLCEYFEHNFEIDEQQIDEKREWSKVRTHIRRFNIYTMTPIRRIKRK